MSGGTVRSLDGVIVAPMLLMAGLVIGVLALRVVVDLVVRGAADGSGASRGAPRTTRRDGARRSRWFPRRLARAVAAVLGISGLSGLTAHAGYASRATADQPMQPAVPSVDQALARLGPRQRVAWCDEAPRAPSAPPDQPGRLLNETAPEPSVVAGDIGFPIVTDSGEMGPTFWPVGGEHSVRTDSQPSARDTVVVHRGDTLWSLAADRLPADAPASVILQAVYQWYRLNRPVIGSDPDLILPGQILRIPALGVASGGHRDG